MQKWSAILIFSEICFREKSSFPKRLDVRFYYESPSKTHARDGSPTNKEIPKKEEPEKNLSQNSFQKRSAIIMKERQQNWQKKELR